MLLVRCHQPKGYVKESSADRKVLKFPIKALTSSIGDTVLKYCLVAFLLQNADYPGLLELVIKILKTDC